MRSDLPILEFDSAPHSQPPRHFGRAKFNFQCSREFDILGFLPTL